MSISKKRFLLLILSVMLTAKLYAVSSQKLFDSNDFEYESISTLCSLTGVTGPSTATPVTTTELLLAYNRIDDSILNEAMKTLYIQIGNILNENNQVFSYDFAIDISPQVFISDKYSGTGISRNYFFLPYHDEKPSININASFSFGNNVFIEGALPLLNSPLKDGLFITSFDWLINHRNGTWNFLGANNTGVLSTIPNLARGAIGTQWINLIVGRTRHSLGSGFTGNMFVGDNFEYQELTKLGFTSNVFSYNIEMTHFDSQEPGKLDQFITTQFGGMHQNRVIHRFDVNLFDKLRLVLNLGTLYYSNTAFDIRWFTPFMIAHNYYNYSENEILTTTDEANNIFVFEIEWAIAPKSRISGQLVLDQFQTFFENGDSLPAAWGGLLNYEYTEMIPDGYMNVWLEGVYTNPFLYLNQKSDQNPDGTLTPNYNYDYILGYHRRSWQESNVNYSGYVYGPDCIVVAAGAEYVNLKHDVSASGSIMYRIKGEKGIYNPTFSESDFDTSTPTGTAEHTIALTMDAAWDIIPAIELFAGTYMAYHINYKNENGNRFIPQAYIGFTWHAL